MLEQKINTKDFVKSVTPWTVRNNVRLKIRAFKAKIWELLASNKIDKEIESHVLCANQVFPFQEIEFCHDYVHLFKNFGFAPLPSYRWIEKVTAIRRTSLIEPARGWIVCPPLHLVKDCLIDSPLIEKPWILDYFTKHRSSSAYIERHPTVISLRDSAECNYWHFFNDLVGGRLRLIEKCSLDPKIPIVISKNLYNQPFFQTILQRTRLSDRSLILQEDQFIESETTFYCQTSRHQKDNINYILELLKVPDSNPKLERRVFLTRGNRSGRNILNVDVIEDICRKFQFEIIDTAQMPLDEQIQLFSECRYVIGIHGAGLTNIIFRKNAMLSLLEIMPPLSNHPHGTTAPPPLHFFYCAHALKFDYDLIIGEADAPGPWTGAFTVDADQFTGKVKDMLAT